jgi:hypothetical protein
MPTQSTSALKSFIVPIVRGPRPEWRRKRGDFDARKLMRRALDHPPKNLVARTEKKRASAGAIEHAHYRDEEVRAGDPRADGDSGEFGHPRAAHSIGDDRARPLQRILKFGVCAGNDQRMGIGAGENERLAPLPNSSFRGGDKFLQRSASDSHAQHSILGHALTPCNDSAITILYTSCSR